MTAARTIATLVLLAAAGARAQEPCDPSREECGPDAPRPSQPSAPTAPAPTLPPASAAQPIAPAPPEANQPWVAPPYGYPPYYQPAPVRTRVEERRRIGLGVGGLSMFAGAWLLTGISGYISGNGLLAIPLFGPLAYIGKYREKFDCTSPDPQTVIYCPAETANDRLMYFWLAVDTIVQVGGVVMAGAGFFTRKKVTVREEPRFTIAPSLGPHGGGLVAAGTF